MAAKAAAIITAVGAAAVIVATIVILLGIVSAMVEAVPHTPSAVTGRMKIISICVLAVRRWAVYHCIAGAAAVTWQHVFTNETYAGGKNHTIAAPLDSFPLFKRVGGSGRTVIQGSAPAIDE